MKKYDIAVFDVDGTLLNTTEGVLNAAVYAIDTLGLPRLTYEQMLTFIGPPIQNSFRRYYELSDERVQEAANIFRSRYKNEDLLKAVPYEGIYETFQKLMEVGVKLAVATYKRQDYAVTLLKYFHFDKYTNILYGADNFNKLKKKDIIIKCMNDLDVYDYSSAVMIGDSDNDALGAQAIGMNFIGVTYGFDFQSREDVCKFPNIGHAEKPTDIIKYFI